MAWQNNLTMPEANHNVTVTYDRCHALNLFHSGDGADPVANLSNSAGCAAGRYLAGTALTLTAESDTGWGIASWSGVDDDEATSFQVGLTMPPADHTVEVFYGFCYQLTLEHSGDGAGLVIDPAHSTGCGAALFVPGAAITVTAEPDPGWSIGGWSGTVDDQAVTTVNQVTMPAGQHLVRVIYTRCHWLILDHTGQGADPVADPAGTPACSSGRFLAGEAITLTAAPARRMDRDRLARQRRRFG